MGGGATAVEARVIALAARARGHRKCFLDGWRFGAAAGDYRTEGTTWGVADARRSACDRPFRRAPPRPGRSLRTGRPHRNSDGDAGQGARGGRRLYLRVTGAH